MKTRALHIAVAATALVAAVTVTPSRTAAAGGECGLPTSTPLWVDYGEASVKPDTRAVLSKPGVVVATSGTAVPAAFRAAGAATTYFELNMNRITGTPAAPADAAGLVAAADAEYDKAVKATACRTPWLILNELSGSNLSPSSSPSNAAYRGNVLTLVQQLAHDGAHPALLVQGNPIFSGDAAKWWKTLSDTGQLVYEAYYDASRIYPLGPLVGSRRMRLGMRLLAHQFESVGVPAAKLGFMLGFHSAQTPGIGGRQGLEPTDAWLRVVKWEALAARQVALDEHIPFLSSWGWGTFGPDSADDDKAAAACTWLWARDPSLCDAPGMAGAGFDSSLLEGAIVLPRGAVCTLGGGRTVTQAEVDRLARLTRDRHAALTAAFVRAVLGAAAPVSRAQVLAAERGAIAAWFHGSVGAYERALARRHADREIALGVIADQLRRAKLSFDRVQQLLGSAADNTICAKDELPGLGRPLVVDNARDVAGVPLPALLPFLFRDRTPPAPPAVPTATRTGTIVTIAWPSGGEHDLLGYDVFRDGTKVTTFGPTGTTTVYDVGAPPGATYTVVALDTSGNRSGPSPASNAA